MKEKFTHNKQICFTSILFLFLLFSNLGFSQRNLYLRATSNAANWSATNSTTYYNAVTGGTAYTASAGAPFTPLATDNVYIVTGSATAFNLTINVENAVCNNLYVIANSTNQPQAATLNIRLGESNSAITRNLTVNGNFELVTYFGAVGTAQPGNLLGGAINRTVNILRWGGSATAVGSSVTSTVTVKGNLIVGQQTGLPISGTSVRANTINIGTYNGTTNQLNAPTFNIEGNLHMHNQIDSALRVNASQVRLNNGTMTLSGDEIGTAGLGKGYVWTTVSNTGISTNNTLAITDNSATLVLNHTVDSPFFGIDATNYSQINPSLNFGTVIYRPNGSPAGESKVFNTSYNNLTINNNASILTIASNNAKISNQLTLESGTTTLSSVLDFEAADFCRVFINGGKIVANSGGYINFNRSTLIEYSNNATETGIEIPNAQGLNSQNIALPSGISNRLNSVILNNTNSNDFIFNNNATANTIILRKNDFTLNDVRLEGLTSITLEGLNTTYNCDLVTKLLNIRNSCNFSKSQTIYSESEITNTTDGLINIGLSNALTYTIKLLNNAIIKTSDLNITSNTIFDETSVGKFNVYRYVSMPNNAARDLTSNGILVLKSNNIQTARIDLGFSGSTERGQIIGDVFVERYLTNSRRTWRLLTAPVVSNTNNTIWENWQNNGVVINSGTQQVTISGVTTTLPINGYGTDLWGPDPSYTMETNGLYYLDPPTGNQTQATSTHNFRKWGLFWDETAQAEIWKWASVTNSKQELMNDGVKNNAFLAFVIKPFGFGVNYNNGIATQVSGSTPTTLLAKGSLLYNTQYYETIPDKFLLVGNPYASSINFNDILDINGNDGTGAIYSKIWFMDPQINSRGGYVTYDPVNLWSNTNSRHATNSDSNIQSGEGFFVMGGANGGQLEINEGMKTNGSSAFVLARTSNTTNVQRIRVNIEKVIDGASTNIDACVVGFYDGGSNEVNQRDVQKLTNPAESISFLTGTSRLSSEHRAPVVNGDELFLRLTSGVVNTTYTLKINTENFNFNGSATFYDLKLGTQISLPLDGSVFVYPFTVTSDATTQGTRFKIVFSNSTLSSPDNSNPLGIYAYPNPALKNDGVMINLGKLEFGNYTYRILNMLGQEIQNGSIACEELNQQYKINFSTAVNTGLYTVELLDQNKSIQTIKIIIK